jgi:hypothetical protein
MINGTSAWSTEYDYSTDTYRPLILQSNFFCSGGLLLPDGRLMTLGGAEKQYSALTGSIVDGFNEIRLIEGSGQPGTFGGKDWLNIPGDPKLKLQVSRKFSSFIKCKYNSLSIGCKVVSDCCYVTIWSSFSSWWM